MNFGYIIEVQPEVQVEVQLGSRFFLTAESHRYKKKLKDGCEWVREDTKKRCKQKSGTKASEACLKTCGDGDGEDASWWYTKKSSNDCAWVRDDTKKRCKAKDKIKAEEACAATCSDACAGGGDEDGDGDECAAFGKKKSCKSEPCCKWKKKKCSSISGCDKDVFFPCFFCSSPRAEMRRPRRTPASQSTKKNSARPSRAASGSRRRVRRFPDAANPTRRSFAS